MTEPSPLADYVFALIGFSCVGLIVWIVCVVLAAGLSIKPFDGVYQGDLFDE